MYRCCRSANGKLTHGEEINLGTLGHTPANCAAYCIVRDRTVQAFNFATVEFGVCNFSFRHVFCHIAAISRG